jgi:superfamily I DNA/RNA helicase
MEANMSHNYQPTDEQVKIINAVRNLEAPVLKVLAFAGTGKTTTLVDAARAIEGKKLYLAFNKSIQLEAKKKFEGLNTVVKTTHGLAFGYIVKERGYKFKHGYNPKEIMSLYDLESKHYWRAKKAKEYFEKFCNGAEDNFNVYAESGKDVSKALVLAEQMFNDMVNKKIDISHSCYLKLFEMELKRGKITSIPYRLIMLDEAQDTNDVTLSIFYHLNAQQRLVVGDRHQQIYSFRGSVNAMSKIKSKSFALTNSFRFTKSIGKKATEFLATFRQETLTIVGRGEEKEKSNSDTTAYISRSNARLIQIFAEYMSEKQYIKPVRDPEAIFGLAINMDRLKHGELELIDREFGFLKEFMYEFKKLPRGKRNELKDVLGYIQSVIQDEDDELIRTIKLLEKYKDIESIYEYALDCNGREEKAFFYATTAHTSKGLEWDHVIIENDFPDWYTIAKWYQKCYGKPPTKVKNPFRFFVENVDNPKVIEDCNAQPYIDELNLYYVAMTRGKYSVEDNTEFGSLSGRESDYDKAIIKAYPKEKDQEETNGDSSSLL